MPKRCALNVFYLISESYDLINALLDVHKTRLGIGKYMEAKQGRNQKIYSAVELIRNNLSNFLWKIRDGSGFKIPDYVWEPRYPAGVHAYSHQNYGVQQVPRGLETEPATHSGGWVFQFAGQSATNIGGLSDIRWAFQTTFNFSCASQSGPLIWGTD